MRGSEKVVVMGDFNARVGEPTIRNEMGNLYEYHEVNDRTKNDHGKKLVNVCNNNHHHHILSRQNRTHCKAASFACLRSSSEQ